MRREEALERLERHLDRAFLQELPTFKILHGKGTGTLKNAIEEFLKNDERVSSFREGEPLEGDWGVTIVELKEDH